MKPWARITLIASCLGIAAFAFMMSKDLFDENDKDQEEDEALAPPLKIPTHQEAVDNAVRMAQEVPSGAVVFGPVATPHAVSTQ